jgi:hypothetical protein
MSWRSIVDFSFTIKTSPNRRLSIARDNQENETIKSYGMFPCVLQYDSHWSSVPHKFQRPLARGARRPGTLRTEGNVGFRYIPVGALAGILRSIRMYVIMAYKAVRSSGWRRRTEDLEKRRISLQSRLSRTEMTKPSLRPIMFPLQILRRHERERLNLAYDQLWLKVPLNVRIPLAVYPGSNACPEKLVCQPPDGGKGWVCHGDFDSAFIQSKRWMNCNKHEHFSDRSAFCTEASRRIIRVAALVAARPAVPSDGLNSSETR